MLKAKQISDLCSFSGCDNLRSPKAARGLCNSHYWQVHKGRELTPLSYRRNRCEPWIDAHVAHQGDECLIWPFQRLQNDGRAAVKYRGKQTVAARVMCEKAHGKPPSPEHEAAHSCGKGHEGCVNPKHLRWATPAENKADQLIHGTRHRGEIHYCSVLTEARVLAIREFAYIIPRQAIADLFGLKRAHVSKIIRRDSWRHI